MARIQALLCAFLVLLVILAPYTAARTLRGGHRDGGRLYEESSKLVKRSSKSGDDAVPTAANVEDYQSKYNEWVQFQRRELTTDYPPAAANPSIPCC